MTETCAVCSKPLKEKYRLRDRFGKPTQLGRMIEDPLDEDLCENTASTVCSKCRYSLLHLEKLKREYDQLKGNLKTHLRRQTTSTQLSPRAQHAPVLRLHSPSAQSTGISPAAKRAATSQSMATSRKELFPLPTTDPCLPEVVTSVPPIARPRV